MLTDLAGCQHHISWLLRILIPGLYLLSDVLSEIIFLSNKTSIVHVMFSELSKERCKICRYQLQLSVVNVFSLVSILFRYFLHYGVRLISAWSAAHLYVEVSTQFSGIVDIITRTALYRVINKAVMMYFDPSTADILAGAHSIEFPAYHYYVATSPPARPMRTSRLRSSQPGRPGPCRRCAGLVLVGTW